MRDMLIAVFILTYAIACGVALCVLAGFIVEELRERFRD